MTTESWNRDPPPGFRGLDPHVPLSVYYRHLPHWRQDGATYFVTFRLADALPQAKLRELESFRRTFLATRCRTDCQSVVRDSQTDCQSVVRDSQTDWQSVLRAISRDAWDAFSLAQMQRVDRWLDQGMGSCWLQRPDVASIVVDALHFGDDDNYELGCYVVMPNHVHLILRPLDPRNMSLEQILQSRKRYMARAINATLGRSGTLWQEESFDRIIRDESHLYHFLQYTGNNPCNAGLPPGTWRRWMRPSWIELGWGFP